jgi:hypothetical protein
MKLQRVLSIAMSMLLASSASTTVFASSQDGLPPLGAGAAQTAAGAQTQDVAADFGTGINILQIPAAAFTPRGSGAGLNTSLPGYLQSTGAVALWAPVFLPSGASVIWLDAYYCDATASATFRFWLTTYTGYSDATANFTDIAYLPSVDGTGSGCQYDTHYIGGHTINNDVRYHGGGQYVINAQADGAGVAFKGVDLWWSRPISPAPATASFTDVPVGSQFFAEVEALKASGITGGCTATTFCPTATVTRLQMAAFLARALGLYWPY